MLTEEDIDRVAKRVLQLSQQQQTSPQFKNRDEMARQLAQQLGPEYISFRSGGGASKVAYLEGHQAIKLANEIFGYDGWSTEIRDRRIEHEPDKAGRICCSVVLRVTIPNGTFREDVGYGTVMKGSNIVADLEKAGKEACTDALKRVLRQYGEPLGNCLYSKNYMSQLRHVMPLPNDLDVDDLRRPAIKRKREPDSPEKIKPKQHVNGNAKPATVPSKQLNAQSKPQQPAAAAAASSTTKPNTTKPPPAKPAAPIPQPIAQSTPLPPPNFILSSSPPDDIPPFQPITTSTRPVEPPAVAEPAAAPRKAETPGLVSGAAIEKFDKTNDWTDASFDASISLGHGCVIDQTKSGPVKKV